MKILLQSTLLTPGDWVEHDHTQWASLPKKAEPRGGETIDDVSGWCHAVNVQGRCFQADHYHVAPLIDGLRMTAWNDDPVDFPPGERYARVVDFLFCAPDSSLGGAINTRQTQVVFAESGARARMSEAIGTTFRDWTLFTPPAVDVMHGVRVSDQLHLDHRAVRSSRGWREWTEGLNTNELDEKGCIKQQRSQGRFSKPDGTRTFFMRTDARANGIHAASDEMQLESSSGSGSLSEATPSLQQELSFLFTTDTNQPNSAAWPTGVYRCQYDVNTIDADMEFGLIDTPGLEGHFGRVDSAIANDLETKFQTQGAISSTGLALVDTGSVSWSSGNANDRFEIATLQRNNATMGGPQSITIDINSDSFADGPWPAAGGAIPVLMHSYRTRRVP